MATNNDVMVLARTTNNILIDIPGNAVLVVENKITKKTTILSNIGTWLTLPALYFNTIIYTKAHFTKQYGEEKYNVTDMPEVRVQPQITFKITKPDIFYERICGRDIKEIKQDSARLDGIYNVIKVAIRKIVRACDFKTADNFLLNTIINDSGNEIYNTSNIPSHVFALIGQEFVNIENTYGIKITQLGFGDVTLPEMVQNAQLAAEKAKHDAVALESTAEGKRKAALKEAEAIKTLIEAYKEVGLSSEEIARIIMMEKTKNGTVIVGSENKTEAMVAQILQNSNNAQNTNENGKSK